MVKNSKIIKDLKERNDKLVNQYRDRDIRCVSLERQLDKLKEENQKMKEVIDNAIQALAEGIAFCKNDSQESFDICNIAIAREQHILDILKEGERTINDGF